MDSGNISLKNFRHQIASQSTKVMTGLAFLLSDDCVLEGISHLRNFPICYLDGSKGMKRSGWCGTSRPRVAPGVNVGGLDGEGKNVDSFLNHWA
jgi:hypothetical protein